MCHVYVQLTNYLELHRQFLVMFKDAASVPSVDQEQSDRMYANSTDRGRAGEQIQVNNSNNRFAPTGHLRSIEVNRFDDDEEIFRRSIDSRSSWVSRGASDRSSPTDQLVAAILDGDVQGIRSIVRAKGDTLHSPYWADITKSILPLHRAISGLHFHGSETVLVSTIETLIQLGCNVKAVDHAGNTAVHKALQVCTSTSVCAVLKVLLAKGTSAVSRNKYGDAPIHTECRR